jgi:uncharacterized LabA/DUF88 family protein
MNFGAAASGPSPSASADQAALLPSSMIFVDGTHVDHRCDNTFGRMDVDFDKFFAKLSRGTLLKRVVYCSAPYKFEPYRRHQQGVKNRFRKLPYVKTYDGRHIERQFHCKNCGHPHFDQVEKGTDVAVASHLVQAACLKEADRLILVAGDNDYWPALHLALSTGADCRFAYFIGPDENRARKFDEVAMLRNNSRGSIVLDDAYMADCWFNK